MTERGVSNTIVLNTCDSSLTPVDYLFLNMYMNKIFYLKIFNSHVHFISLFDKLLTVAQVQKLINY